MLTHLLQLHVDADVHRLALLCSLSCLPFLCPRQVRQLDFLPTWLDSSPLTIEQFARAHERALTHALHVLQTVHFAAIIDGFVEHLHSEYKRTKDANQRRDHYRRFERIAQLVNAMARDALRSAAIRAIRTYVSHAPYSISSLP